MIAARSPACLANRRHSYSSNWCRTAADFGGKEDMTIQAQTALLARMTGRPVRIALNREESIRMHPKRHPLTMTYTVGCDADGHLTAARIDILGDSGAYASVGGKVLERAAGHACGPYRMPVLAIEGVAAYTNNPPCGAMRGFGVNQTSFAIEGCLDLLAAKAGIDRWEIRWRNALHVGDMFSTGQILEKSVGIAKTLLAVKPAYDAACAQGRAVGIACGIKNSGIGNGAIEYGKCRLVVQPDGTIDLHTGFTEMGQGLLTMLTQCAVEVTGLPAGIFRPQVNSRFEIGTGHTTGSRATLLAGPAVIDAATKLKADLDRGMTVAGLAGRVYAGEYCINDTTAPGETKHGKIKTHTTFGFATQVVVLSETRRRRTGDRRARRRPRAESAAMRGADPGRRAYGPGLRPDRGASLQGRHAGDLQAARDRRAARPAHARGRGHPGRGPRTGGPVRRQGCRRDRPRADRRRRGGRPGGVRRRAAHASADEGFRLPRAPSISAAFPMARRTNGIDRFARRRPRSQRAPRCHCRWPRRC